MARDALAVLLAGSPYAQIVFEVATGGALVGVVATQAARRSGLLLVDDVAGRTLDDVVRPELARSLRDGFRNALRLGGEPVSQEEFVSLGRRDAWGMTTLTPLCAEGVPEYLVVSFIELDFLERTESALSRVEACLAHVVDASSDAILVTRNGLVTRANAIAAKRFGAKVVGSRVDAILPALAEVKIAEAPVSVTTTSGEVVVIPLSWTDEAGLLLVVR